MESLIRNKSNTDKSQIAFDAQDDLEKKGSEKEVTEMGLRFQNIAAMIRKI